MTPAIKTHNRETLTPTTFNKSLKSNVDFVTRFIGQKQTGTHMTNKETSPSLPPERLMVALREMKKAANVEGVEYVLCVYSHAAPDVISDHSERKKLLIIQWEPPNQRQRRIGFGKGKPAAASGLERQPDCDWSVSASRPHFLVTVFDNDDDEQVVAQSSRATIPGAARYAMTHATHVNWKRDHFQILSLQKFDTIDTLTSGMIALREYATQGKPVALKGIDDREPRERFHVTYDNKAGQFDTVIRQQVNQQHRQFDGVSEVTTHLIQEAPVEWASAHLLVLHESQCGKIAPQDSLWYATSMRTVSGRWGGWFVGPQ